jgi:hypothetical protein
VSLKAPLLSSIINTLLTVDYKSLLKINEKYVEFLNDKIKKEEEYDEEND